ncbi:hypothetical protein ACIP5N_22040 [Streptomyces sp. NPDC088768]|uniref:hypothetical protein n=1 Tax=Streptomyces sp. NPDC088768 TaxID=3365894 RepID=UPI003811EF96
MSVTFTADWRPATRFAVTCGCARATALAVPHDTYEEASVETLNAGPARGALPGCAMPEICPEYPLYVHDVGPGGEFAPEVNVSQRNAALLTSLLDFTVTGTTDAPCPPHLGDGQAGGAGQLPAEDFLGRVLVALALTPEDEGVNGYWDRRHHLGGRAAAVPATSSCAWPSCATSPSGVSSAATTWPGAEQHAAPPDAPAASRLCATPPSGPPEASTRSSSVRPMSARWKSSGSSASSTPAATSWAQKTPPASTAGTPTCSG